MRTPDFTGMPNLEYLDLRSCSSLEEVHHSLGYSRKLIQLNLYHCESLKRFPCVNVESLEHLDLRHCSSLEKFPDILGRMKPELKIDMAYCGIRELPSAVILYQTHITKLDLRLLEDLVTLPSSIGRLKILVELYVWGCSKLEGLPEEIGDLENLEKLDASYTLISQPPPSIVRLNKLKFLSFAKYCDGASLEDGVYFVFPPVNEGLRSLEDLDLSYCNLIDGGLPEDIGCLSSLKKLKLGGNKFDYLPRSLAQLRDLRSLDLRECNSLMQLPKLPPELDELHADCHLVVKSIHNLVTQKKLQRVVLSPLLDKYDAYNESLFDSFALTLFQNISSLHHDISASNSLSERVFTIVDPGNGMSDMIPRWFHDQEMDTIDFPENWYICDSFLGFAICYSGNLIETTVQLIALYNDEMSWMTQKLAYYSEYENEYGVHYFFVPFACIWDKSKANGKTPNDYRYLTFSRKVQVGLHLLYKDEPELEALLQIRGNSVSGLWIPNMTIVTI